MVVALIALAVAGQATLFAVIQQSLLMALPFPRGEELVSVSKRALESGLPVVFDAEFKAWEEGLTDLADFAAYDFRDHHVNVAGAIERVRVVRGTDRFFRVFGLEITGPGFSPASPAPRREVVLTRAAANRLLPGKSDIVGLPLIMNGATFRVVGVLHEPFDFPGQPPVSLVIPFDLNGTPASPVRVVGFVNQIVARLKPGVTQDVLVQKLGTVDQRVLRDIPPKLSQRVAGSELSVRSLRSHLTLGLRRPMLVLLIAVSSLWLVASLNAASLQLTRMVTREGEFKIKTALGCGAWQLAADITSEMAVLTVAAILIGIGAAAWIIELLPAYLEVAGVSVPALSFSWMAAWVGVGAGTLSGAVCVLLPLVRAQRLAAGRGIALSGRSELHRSQGAMSSLVVLQLSTSTVLLVAAALLFASFRNLVSPPLGFLPDGVVYAELSDAKGGLLANSPVVREGMIEALLADPRFSIAAAGTTLPLYGPTMTTPVEVQGGGIRLDLESGMDAVSPDYFRTLGVSVLAGREFVAGDKNSSPRVAVVNDALARRVGGGSAILGRVLVVDDNEPARVVGVVGDVRRFDLLRSVEPHVFVPLSQAPPTEVFVLGRTLRSVDWVTASKATARNVSPGVTTHGHGSLAEDVAKASGPERLMLVIIVSLAVFAVLVSASGVVALSSYATSTAVREIAIRRALGATHHHIVRRQLTRWLPVGVAGAAIGVVASLWLGRLAGRSLHGVAPGDSSVLLTCACITIALCLLAAIPATVRALRVAPAAVLRGD